MGMGMGIGKVYLSIIAALVLGLKKLKPRPNFLSQLIIVGVKF